VRTTERKHVNWKVHINKMIPKPVERKEIEVVDYL